MMARVETNGQVPQLIHAYIYMHARPDNCKQAIRSFRDKVQNFLTYISCMHSHARSPCRRASVHSAYVIWHVVARKSHSNCVHAYSHVPRTTCLNSCAFFSLRILFIHDTSWASPFWKTCLKSLLGPPVCRVQPFSHLSRKRMI